MITMISKDIKRMERELKTFAHRAFPFATRSTVNTAAFKTQRLARGDLDVKMTLRNRWTKQGIQVQQTRSLHVPSQEASVGSIADYMAVQEDGGVKRRNGREGVPIATAEAANQKGRRTRLPRGRNHMKSIKLRGRAGKYKNRKQRNAALIRMASTSSNKFVFLNLGRRKGIFRVRGRRKSLRIRMIYDLTRESVTIPRNPWLGPAVEQIESQLDFIYADALSFQIRRNRLFENR